MRGYPVFSPGWHFAPYLQRTVIDNRNNQTIKAGLRESAKDPRV
jgi:hypothetical protein